jgi:hypothetical protein
VRSTGDHPRCARWSAGRSGYPWQTDPRLEIGWWVWVGTGHGPHGHHGSESVYRPAESWPEPRVVEPSIRAARGGQRDGPCYPWQTDPRLEIGWWVSLGAAKPLAMFSSVLSVLSVAWFRFDRTQYRKSRSWSVRGETGHGQRKRSTDHTDTQSHDVRSHRRQRAILPATYSEASRVSSTRLRSAESPANSTAAVAKLAQAAAGARRAASTSPREEYARACCAR